MRHLFLVSLLILLAPVDSEGSLWQPLRLSLPGGRSISF
jgi:hypothetical protein